MCVCRFCGNIFSGSYCPKCGEWDNPNAFNPYKKYADGEKPADEHSIFTGHAYGHGDSASENEKDGRTVLDDSYVNVVNVQTGEAKCFDMSVESEIKDLFLGHMEGEVVRTERGEYKILSIVSACYSVVDTDADNGQPPRRESAPSYGMLYMKTGEGSALVSCGTCEDENVVIQSEYESLPVTEIKDSVFDGFRFMRSIDIPGSVTAIGKHAFWNCPNLKTLYIADIGSWCGINFGDRWSNPMIYLTYICLGTDSVPFDGELVIPDGTTQIKKFAFYGCRLLRRAFIPGSVTQIGEEAFCCCSNLESVIVHDSIKTIGPNAFYSCMSLKNVFCIGTSHKRFDISSGGSRWPTGATIYYFSETRPLSKGNFWHYVSGVPAVWRDE